jgi:hypothetical protein
VKECPEGKTFCLCLEFSKEGLCDWPYRIGISFEEDRYMTEILRVIGKSCSVVVQINAEDYRKEGREHRD